MASRRRFDDGIQVLRALAMGFESERESIRLGVCMFDLAYGFRSATVIVLFLLPCLVDLKMGICMYVMMTGCINASIISRDVELQMVTSVGD